MKIQFELDSQQLSELVLLLDLFILASHQSVPSLNILSLLQLRSYFSSFSSVPTVPNMGSEESF